jgi:hypothetical protein
MAEGFDKVHTIAHYNDGPRLGIADFEGRPHLYKADRRDGEDEYASIFVLSPLSDEVFRLAMEDWGIRRSWQAAFLEGLTTRETQPALPEDQDRHKQLVALIGNRLVIDPARSLRARAEFRIEDPTWRGRGFPPLEVRWERVEAGDRQVPKAPVAAAAENDFG